MIISLDCKTISGPKTDYDCVFPFIYQSVEYHECSLVDNNNEPWCATQVGSGNQFINPHWGNCADTCPSPSNSPSSPGSPEAVNYAYIEYGTGERYNSGSQVSGSYSNGQECCDLCAADNQNTIWISYALAGSPSECRCRNSPSSFEPMTSFSGGNNWGRGSCLLPQDFVYTETGEGNRYNLGQTVYGSYTTGQDCCDLCFANNDNVRWISWVRPGTSTPAQCNCKPTSDEPNSPNNAAPYADWSRGSCQNRFTYSGRKKRALTPWNDLSLELEGSELMEKVEKARYAREAETELETEMRSYGSRLRYECGLARKFYDPESEEYYQERWMQCNWNQSWTQYDTLDDCIWRQCLYPPDPPAETQLILTWDSEPVEFNDNVSYVCGDQYFEWDRDMPEFNITCLEGGTWDAPEVWPICVPSKISQKVFQIFTFAIFSCKLHRSS